MQLSSVNNSVSAKCGTDCKYIFVNILNYLFCYFVYFCKYKLYGHKWGVDL